MNPNQVKIIDEVAVRQLVQLASVTALNACVVQLSSDIRLRLSQPGTGRQYFRGPGYGKRRNLRQKGIHVASAPGFPPAPDTKLLVNSLSVSTTGQPKVKEGFFVKKIEPNMVVARYGTKVPYAVFLERGTRRMRRRPYAAVSVDRFRPDVEKTFAVIFRKYFPKGTA